MNAEFCRLPGFDIGYTTILDYITCFVKMTGWTDYI